VQSNLAILDSKSEKKILQEKNAMWDVQKSKTWSKSGDAVSWQVRGIARKEPVQGHFFFVVPEIQSSSHHQASVITKAV
jgi:hypothetical protein